MVSTTKLESGAQDYELSRINQEQKAGPRFNRRERKEPKDALTRISRINPNQFRTRNPGARCTKGGARHPVRAEFLAAKMRIRSALGTESTQ